MGQMWAKNMMFYPNEYPDEQTRDIPHPRVELYDHVVTKATQVSRPRGFSPNENEIVEEKSG